MTVPNMHPKISESLQFIRSDGTVYELNSPPTRGILNMSGWGKPEEEKHAVSGPYQHGETVVSYRLQPRIITVDIAHSFLSRTEWHSGRSNLVNQMGLNNASSNSPVAGTLRWSYLSGLTYVTRDIKVFLQKGLGFSPLEGWRQWSILESLEFVAPDPVIYDPAVKTSTINSFTLGLLFPVTMPFVLGASYGTSTINYAGTWESYPTITITGPASGVYIENTSTGEWLRLDYNISVGESVVFDLAYNTKTVTNDVGTDLLQYLSDDSNLGSFSLQTLPNNVIGTYIIGPGTTTTVVFNYFNRYYGI